MHKFNWCTLCNTDIKLLFNMNKAIIIGMLLLILPIVNAITVHENVSFLPHLANFTYNINETSTAYNITINETCIIIDGNTTINGIDLCNSNGSEDINFTIPSIPELITFIFQVFDYGIEWIKLTW